MNQIDRFIQVHQLKPGDAVVINKAFFETSDPYAVYLGRTPKGNHVFWVRAGNIIRRLKTRELIQLFERMPPRRVNRFVGNQKNRKAIVQNAIEKKDRSAYSLILNNCEDYASLHKRKSDRSEPNTGAVIGTIIGVAAIAILLGAIFGGSDDDS